MEFLFLIGKFLFFTILGELLRPKRPESRNAAGGLKDLSFPTVDPTRPHQWLIGKRMIDSANLFATFDFLGVERSKKMRTGLISSESVPLPPVYYISAAMVLCAGSGARLREVWVGDRLAWTGNIGTGQQAPVNIEWTEDGQEEAPRGVKGVIDFYSGHPTPSAYLESKKGVGNVPSWKHLTYAVLRGPDGGVSIPPTPLGGLMGATTTTANGAWVGTSKQVEHLKFVVERMPTAASTGLGVPADGGSYWTVGDDANPAYAAAEILTNRQFGAGIDPELLDIESFHAAAKVLKEENHGTSQVWDNQRVSGDVVLELMRQTGMLLQPDPVTGKHKLRLLRETEEAVISLDDSNIKRIHSYSRAAMDEATNALSLEYTAASEKWQPRPVEVQDLAAIEVAGQVITGTASYAGITNSNLAQILALRDLRALSAPLATVRLDAIVGKRQRFIPGDPVNFTATDLGIVSLRMRVTSARYAKPGESVCELELVEDVFKSGIALYTTPAGIGYTPPSFAAPPSISTHGVINAPYALTGDAAAHALHYAFAPADTANGYDVSWYSDTPADLQQHDRNGIGYAAQGYTTVALVDITTPSTLALSVSASSAATLRRFAGAQLYCFFGNSIDPGEWLQATSVSVNPAGTVATLSGLTRGIFGTTPVARASGAALTLLCDYAIDPARLKTTLYNGFDLMTDYPGANVVGAFAYNRLGTKISAATAYAAQQYAGVGQMLGALPYAPGAVKLQGKFGASSSTATLPTVASAAGGKLVVTLKHRNRLEKLASGWDTGDARAEPGISIEVVLSVGGSTITSAILTPGAESVELVAPATTARNVELTVSPFLPKPGFPGNDSRWPGETWHFRQLS